MSDSLLNGLNAQQLAAVKKIHGPLMVLAGAGTGKTKVITTRIAWMLLNKIAPEEIVALSFTNKAAREMRERLGSMVGTDISKRVLLSTFHSFALRILREYNEFFGIERNFTIADEGVARQILRESLRELNLLETMPLAVAAEKISYFKDKLYSEADFLKRTNLIDGVVMRKLFTIYNARLRLGNYVDFDDLVYLCAVKFKENKDLVAKLTGRYKYLMVDEYQDTNNAQFEFIKSIAGIQQNICVVGDDDQSIYSWRGAKGDVLFQFLKEYPTADRVTLEENYRCSPTILEAANAVITINPKRLSKQLWSQKPNKHRIGIHAAEENKDEALFVANTIQEIKCEEPETPFDSFAILVRTTEQMLPLEQMFAQKKLPYIVHGGTRFLDRHEIRVLFSYLKLAANEADLNALFTVINTPSRGLGTVSLEKIKSEFLKNKEKYKAVYPVLSDLFASHKGVVDFMSKWTPIREKFRTVTDLRTLRETLLECYEKAGLKDDILRSSRDMQDAKYKMDNVQATLEAIENLELKQFSIQNVLDSMQLDDSAFSKEKKEKKNAIQLMTIHAAKGLEFDTVFLVGIEDGIMPHARSVEELGVLDEERRLFYVALTRAKQRLYISHCGLRRSSSGGSREMERKPSPFLANIPAHLIAKSEANFELAEVKKAAAARRLFDLFR